MTLVQKYDSETKRDSWSTRLRQRVEFCKFGDHANEQIRDRVIENCVSHQLKWKSLEKGHDLSLDQLRTIARAFESCEKQTQSIARAFESSEKQTQFIARAFQSSEKQIKLLEHLSPLKSRHSLLLEHLSPVRSRQSMAMESSMKTETDPVKWRGTETQKNFRNASDKKCYRCDGYGHTSTDLKCLARIRRAISAIELAILQRFAIVERKWIELLITNQQKIKLSLWTGVILKDMILLWAVKIKRATFQ